MNTTFRIAAGLTLLAAAVPLRAGDAAGCKDHPLFNRMPHFEISGCDATQFDMKRFPAGPAVEDAEGLARPKSVEVEGAFTRLTYQLKEGAPRPSPLQTMRNFESAARKAGATIEGQYPDWCKAYVDDTLHDGNACIFYGLTMKFSKNGRETWAFMESDGDGEIYELWLIEREAMKQDIVANELLDKLNQDGFVALYINFDTAKASIKPDSNKTLDDVAAALRSAPGLKLEVAGHTDNVGNAEANLQLSDARARAVVAALVQRGVDAQRLTPKGYGQSTPVADNRSEDGRARNRRVELVKQ